jgi:hypothetical protein
MVFRRVESQSAGAFESLMSSDGLQQGVPELRKKYSGTLQYPASFGFGNDFPVELLK